MQNVKHRIGRLFALVAASAFAVAMTLGASASAQELGPAAPEVPTGSLVITKVLVGPTAEMPASQKFTFTFEKVSLNDDTAQAQLDRMPEIADQVCPIGTDNGAFVSSKTEGASTTLRQDMIPNVDWGAFTNAGVYAYRVKEVGTAPGVTMSQAEYVMKVYVNRNGLIEIHVEKHKDDQGVDQGGVKVNPRPGDPGNIVNPDDAVEGGSEFAFTNTIAPSDTGFTLTKKVAGAYGDRGRGFEFGLTVTIPVTAAQPAQGFKAVHSDGTEYFFKTGVPTNFTLKHDEKLVFDALPSGTLVTYSETGVEGYTASSSTTVDGKAAVAQQGQKGVDFTLDNAVLGKTDNSSVITNTYQDVTPTGLAITVLPFVLMIAVPAIGGIAYIAMKRRFGTRA